ncbi:MAG: YidC/Oxa1 family insertase periplasmic-domain containing protein [Bacillota bacterium]
METKRLVIVVLLSMAVVFLWSYAASFIRQRHPEWYEQKAPVATTQPVEQGPATAAGNVATTTQPGGVGVGGLQVAGQGEASTVTLGDTQYQPGPGYKPFPIGVTLTSQGAAIQTVTLNHFKEQVKGKEPYVFQRPYEQVPAAFSHALATRSVTVNGVTTDLAGVNWNRTATTENSAQYAVNLQGATGQPSLTVAKQYQVKPANDPSKGYELVLTYSFKNPTNEPVKVKTVFNGPNVPHVEIQGRDIPEAVVGHNDEQYVTLQHHPTSSFAPDKPAMDLRSNKGQPFLWSGFINAYFEGIVRPEVKDGKTPSLADVKAQAVGPKQADGREPVVMSFETAELTVPAGQEVSVPFHVYFGPRWRDVLNSDYYSQFPLNYDKTLVLTGGLCGFCTFQWLINLLVWMLKGFHFVLRDWGLAIIALVVVVRLLLHPITKKSQISMSKMSKMGPEMERLKQKYGDNKDELNKAMMQFYKEQGVTPILGCLPMLLQMPIWIALWTSLQSTFELRHASFLWGFTWIKDLAQPDQLIPFSHSINLFLFTLSAINLLPILLGVVFYLQQKMTPKPAAMTPEQEQQQKMMQWMSLLFPLLLYTGPSGLNLYILTSTAIGIWESKRVRDHIQAQEEAEKAGKVIIDAKATRASRRHAREERTEAPKATGLAGLFARLQAKAEEMRGEMEKKGRRQ